MPKKQKRTEQEIHAMIVRDAKIRLGCADFEPDFTLYEPRDQTANWDVHSARNGRLAARLRPSIHGGRRSSTPQVRHCLAAGLETRSPNGGAPLLGTLEPAADYRSIPPVKF